MLRLNLIGRLTLDVQDGGGGCRSGAVDDQTCVTSCILHTHFLYLQEVKTRAFVHTDPPTKLKLHLPLTDSHTEAERGTERERLSCIVGYVGNRFNKGRRVGEEAMSDFFSASCGATTSYYFC